MSDRWVPTINAVTAYELGFLDSVRVKEREREKIEREREKCCVYVCLILRPSVHNNICKTSHVI